MKKSILLAVFACAALSACASTPDPEKICTSEWIGERSSKALDRIETRSKSSMNSLKKAGESWVRGKQPGPFQLLALSNSMKKLQKELTSGQGIQDLRTMASTCNDPQIIQKAMDDLIDRQDFSPRFKAMLDQNPFFQNIMQNIINSAVTGQNAQT